MLHVHRAERGDLLVDGLARVLAVPLDDPFRPEVVAVPTRGVERWVTQRLSGVLGTTPQRGDGVCANVEFPFPGTLVGAALAAATGVHPDADPWVPERSVWPLLDVVDDHLDAPWMAALAAHLGHRAGQAAGGGSGGDQPRAGRRFAAVRHLADLFDRYAVHRPAMLRSWAAGADDDGRGGPLPDDMAWQASLWRALRARIGGTSPAERMADACARLAADPALVDLPGRLSLFGLTRLPASYLDVVTAIAAHRDVHLWLLHPSPDLWARIAGRPGPAAPVGPRRSDPTATLARNPLLATWGRDAREMQLVLAAGTGARTDDHREVGPVPATLLGRLQDGVRGDIRPPGIPRPGTGDGRPVLAADDRSVQVHACHGRGRQVEVLRDAILHLLVADPTLEPRDVIVMCPDIDAFAPLIHATFGLLPLGGEGGGDPAATALAASTGLAATPAPGHDLRVRLADRSLRQTNPVLGAVAQLLDLASSRMTATQVLDLAGTAPVRRRFRFDDDDLVRINEWVAEAGIRWGLDGDHREGWLLGGVEAGTWAAGLRRILLGVAMSEDGCPVVDGVLPLDDVDSGDIDLAGRLAEFVDRLGAAVRTLRGPAPVQRWLDAIREAAAGLVATSATDDWQLGQMEAMLDDVAAAAGPGTAVLGLTEVRSLLADRLRGRPTRANFRTGHLTMCTLVPMRSVPHRVVCLLGLDDGVFPRRTTPDGDDLISRDPWVGDRDARSEDRQLLLDALLAAEDHLVVTYNGRDERTNAPLPPAVPLGELLDVVDRTVRPADPHQGAARCQVVTHHPLQPYDARNFVAGDLISGEAWSFDAAALAGARAATGPRVAVPPFLDGPLPPLVTDPLELDDLVRFVQHPTRAFLRRRLGITLRDDDEDPDDALPIAPDGLARWGVGNRLLEARLHGLDPATCVASERARGALPPGLLGTRVLDEVEPRVERLVGASLAEIGAGDPDALDAVVDLGGGRLLTGTVGGVVGDAVRTVTYSRLGPKHRLAAWVRLLALVATFPDRPLRAVTIGRGRGETPEVRIASLRGTDPDDRRVVAGAYLRALVDLFDRGMREPLPLYCETSEAYVRGGRVAAEKAWTTSWDSFDREDRDPAHLLVLTGPVPFDRLLDEAAGTDECGPGWAEGDPTRVGRLAHRLWDGLIANEQAG